jgi:hypothetical protein
VTVDCIGYGRGCRVSRGAQVQGGAMLQGTVGVGVGVGPMPRGLGGGEADRGSYASQDGWMDSELKRCTLH